MLFFITSKASKLSTCGTSPEVCEREDEEEQPEEEEEARTVEEEEGSRGALVSIW